MIGQKEAVIQLVSEILGDNAIGSVNVKKALSKEQVTKIRSEVLSGILKNTIEYNGDKSDLKKLTRYVNGMIDNHFRKARELNGGSNYLPKGSRTVKDPQLNALKRLYGKMPEGSEGQMNVQRAIMEREQQLRAKGKVTAPQNATDGIDVNSLPKD